MGRSSDPWVRSQRRVARSKRRMQYACEILAWVITAAAIWFTVVWVVWITGVLLDGT